MTNLQYSRLKYIKTLNSLQPSRFVLLGPSKTSCLILVVISFPLSEMDSSIISIISIESEAKTTTLEHARRRKEVIFKNLLMKRHRDPKYYRHGLLQPTLITNTTAWSHLMVVFRTDSLEQRILNIEPIVFDL